MSSLKASTGPLRVKRPTPNSIRISGMLQSQRKQNHTSKKTSPPPSVACLAQMRGNLHMLPVPTTEPRLDMRTENDEVKVLCGGWKEEKKTVPPPTMFQ